jgi:YfiH family protein
VTARGGVERAVDPLLRRRAMLTPQWPAPAHVRAFTTLRAAGDVGVSQPPFDRFNLGLSCGDDPAAVAINREQLCAISQLPAAPCWLRQVHGIDVVRFDRASVKSPTADAAVTESSGRVLAILTADCLPLLLCDDMGTAVGAAHAGWRGLAAGVIEATVRALDRPPQSLIAWLGPAAGPDAYEVGDDVRTAFVETSPAAARAFIATRRGHWNVDLYALARQRLSACGVTRVHGGDLCTISDRARFFSHRRDGRSGRMATLIWFDSASDG